jgi:copper resistance protein D
MDDMLVVSRALHFTATVLATGIVAFLALIKNVQGQGFEDYRCKLRLVCWISLGVALASGAAWLMAVSASIDDAPWMQTLADGTAMTVLTGTQFGQAWLARLAVGLWTTLGSLNTAVQLALAAVFAGGMVFGGHAAGTPGLAGDVHLAGDILHIIAASTWVGGLLPYALFLALINRHPFDGSGQAAREVTRRFANVGLVAVLAIIASGIVNTINLVGSWHALIQTDYGRLLTIKVGLFLVMVVFASINRLALTPRLPDLTALSKIRRNSASDW